MRCVVTTTCLFVLLGSTAQARVWQVPAEVSTIQAGLDLASPGDIVEVACGTYLEHDLAMISGVILRSESGEADCVTIDAQSLGRVLTCAGVDTAARIEGFTLTGGLLVEPPATACGAGLYCADSFLTITHCRFVANEAAYGGGMYCRDSGPVISDCEFRANVAEYGGGLYCLRSDAEVTACLFTGHVETIDGGGLYCSNSSPAVTDCLFAGNRARVWGAGVFCTTRSYPVLTRCTLAANHAYDGGGIWCVDECQVTLNATLVAFNTHGTGISVYDNPSHPAAVSLACCDVFGNVGGNFGGVAEDQIGENGNISVDPLFCDVDAGDFTLHPSSPCLPASNDCGELIGAFAAGCDLTGAPAPALTAATLHPCRPNPFNPRTTIRYALPAAAYVRLEVYALDGARVATLVDESRAAGDHASNWNGRDDGGRDVPAGIYLCRLTVGREVSTQRMALIR